MPLYAKQDSQLQGRHPLFRPPAHVGGGSARITVSAACACLRLTVQGEAFSGCVMIEGVSALVLSGVCVSQRRVSALVVGATFRVVVLVSSDRDSNKSGT